MELCYDLGDYNVTSENAVELLQCHKNISFAVKCSISLLIFEIIKCFIWSDTCLEKCIKLKKKKTL